MAVDKVCATCAYFDNSADLKDPEFGICRRWPPPPATRTGLPWGVKMGDGEAFVYCHSQEWCGEWKKA